MLFMRRAIKAPVRPLKVLRSSRRFAPYQLEYGSSSSKGEFATDSLAPCSGYNPCPHMAAFDIVRGAAAAHHLAPEHEKVFQRELLELDREACGVEPFQIAFGGTDKFFREHTKARLGKHHLILAMPHPVLIMQRGVEPPLLARRILQKVIHGDARVAIRVAILVIDHRQHESARLEDLVALVHEGRHIRAWDVLEGIRVGDTVDRGSRKTGAPCIGRRKINDAEPAMKLFQ